MKYKIIRFYRDDKPSEVVARGLTLEQAQAHCQREDTHGEGWFDGYDVDSGEDHFGLNQRMKVAPYQSCLVCFKGDTQTGVAFSGEAEFIMAGLMAKLNLPEDEAHTLVHLAAEEQYGCDPGMVPEIDMVYAFRLCEDCAQKKGLDVGPLTVEKSIPLYSQPDHTRREQ